MILTLIPGIRKFIYEGVGRVLFATYITSLFENGVYTELRSVLYPKYDTLKIKCTLTILEENEDANAIDEEYQIKYIDFEIDIVCTSDGLFVDIITPAGKLSTIIPLKVLKDGKNDPHSVGTKTMRPAIKAKIIRIAKNLGLKFQTTGHQDPVVEGFLIALRGPAVRVGKEDDEMDPIDNTTIELPN